MPAPAFMKLKVDHKTVLCRDLNTYRSLRDFLLNSGYVGVYETERVGEEQTAMATFACRSGLPGEFLTPIYKDKDSFGPLLQAFTRELFDDEWFFIEFVQRDYDPDAVSAVGTRFVQNTVKSLYVSKQEEFREWEKTGKKRKFLDGVPEKERSKLLQDIFANTEPKGYVQTVAPVARNVKLSCSLPPRRQSPEDVFQILPS